MLPVGVDLDGVVNPSRWASSPEMTAAPLFPLCVRRTNLTSGGRARASGPGREAGSVVHKQHGEPVETNLLHHRSDGALVVVHGDHHHRRHHLDSTTRPLEYLALAELYLKLKVDLSALQSSSSFAVTFGRSSAWNLRTSIRTNVPFTKKTSRPQAMAQSSCATPGTMGVPGKWPSRTRSSGEMTSSSAAWVGVRTSHFGSGRSGQTRCPAEPQ